MNALGEDVNAAQFLYGSCCLQDPPLQSPIFLPLPTIVQNDFEEHEIHVEMQYKFHDDYLDDSYSL